MASVQELLLAAQAQKSPFISLLEGAAQGFGQAQDQALERSRMLIQMENQRQDRERAMKEDAEARALLSGGVERGVQQGFKGISPIPSPFARQKFVEKIAPGAYPGTFRREYVRTDVTGAEMDETGAKLEESRLRREGLEAERVARGSERKQARYRNYLLDIEQRDPVIKDLRKQDISMSQVENLVDTVRQGNTVAAAALGIKMAKGMGEVGVMTETDVTRYVQSRRLDRKAADILTNWVKGRPTEATLDEINQIAGVLGDTFQSKIQPRYDKFISAYSKIEKVQPEQFAADLSLPYSGGPKKPSVVVNGGGVDLGAQKAALRAKLGLGGGR